MMGKPSGSQLILHLSNKIISIKRVSFLVDLMSFIKEIKDFNFSNQHSQLVGMGNALRLKITPIRSDIFEKERFGSKPPCLLVINISSIATWYRKYTMNQYTLKRSLLKKISFCFTEVLCFEYFDTESSGKVEICRHFFVGLYFSFIVYFSGLMFV